MAKYIAKEIESEWTESMLFAYNAEEFCEMYPDVGIKGLDRYTTDINMDNELFSMISQGYEEIAYYADYYLENGTYKNFTEIIHDFFPRVDGKRYNSYDIGKFIGLLDLYGTDRYWRGYTEEIFIPILEMVTREIWDVKEIHGCCQGDNAYVIYPSGKYDNKTIDWIETNYFNLGREFLVEDEEDDILTSVYVDTFNGSDEPDDIKKVIAEYIDIPVEEIELKMISGYQRIVNYETY